MTRWRARHRGTSPDRGAAAVEFAIVLSVLLLIIFGIIDFGRLLYVVQSANAAAREGARSAAVRTVWGATGNPASTAGSPSGVVLAVRNSASAAAGLAGGTISVRNSWTDTDTPPGTLSPTTGSVSTATGQPCPPSYTAGYESRAVTITVTISPFRWFTPLFLFTSSVNSASASATMRCE